MLESLMPVRVDSAAVAAHAPPDLLLIERARGADAGAIEALMRRYGQRLYRIARSVLPDADAAERAVEDAYAAAFADLGRHEPTGRFAAWLTRTVLAQSAARAAVRPAACAPPAPPAPPAPARALEAAIDALPEVFRTVFVLRVVEGISGTETAAALGLNLTTVRTRLYRAHRRLAAGTGLGTAHTAFELEAARAERIVAGALGRLGLRAAPAP
jgi:RNA polymerase sigma-70 factor, ECF subfamily